MGISGIGSPYSTYQPAYQANRPSSPAQLGSQEPSPHVGNPGADVYQKDDLATREAKRTGKVECQTCSERKYQDGSDDPSVSFKTPTKIAPEAAAAAVMSHELEHVSHEQQKAAKEGRKIVSQNVRIHMSVCPECGKSYVSGGKTTTVSKSDPKREDQNPSSGNEAAPDNATGTLIDVKA